MSGLFVPMGPVDPRNHYGSVIFDLLVYMVRYRSTERG